MINEYKLKIATANSRRAKTWRNRTMTWSAIVDKMATTVRTPETVAEYKAMTKDRQSEVKDVGAFVLGYCINGSRSDIYSRSALALDADFAGPDLWDDWRLTYGNAAAIYSTHKHTPAAPRLRLVIPLSRDVSPDEYQAVARRVAEGLGIDQFDDSTYQPQRCMFWPSTSSDGEYIFDSLDAPLLNPDDVLATYVDWRDISAWPMSSRVTEVNRKEAERQQDPTTKPGLVGAFCRAYSIHDAIASFVSVYEACADPGRYTFREGSTGAGVVTYDDMFSYSFHATDPASGQLCNAWDLVRLHMFGGMDIDTDPGTPAAKRPSWSAMMDFAAEDTNVRAQVLQDRADDFSEPFPEGEQDWRGQIKVTKGGAAAATIENIVIILKNDPVLSGRLFYDEMAHNIMASDLPWRQALEAWTDSDDAALRYYLEKAYGLSCKDKIFDGVNVVAMERKQHPVRDYLNGLTWDGVPRVETLLCEYLGAVDNEYTRAVTRKTLVAAVARVFRPGCKFDYMLTFRGRQGLGKSTLIRKLGGPWYSDTFGAVQGKDSYEQLSGVWLMEVGELAGMRKAEAETIKLYISKQVDRFRPAYGRRTQEFPRQCIFLATTNENSFLRDTTGNRRFWIVDTPKQPRRAVWDDLDQGTVDQVWAEAVQLFRKGEPLYLSPELEAVARRVQAEYEEENPRAGMIEAYLDRLLPAKWENMGLYERRQFLESAEAGVVRRDTVSAIEVFAEVLGGNPERLDRYAINEINDILCALPGWTRSGGGLKTVKPYGRQRYYKREEE